MIKVNMYGLMPNDRIQNENVPIYRSIEELYKGMRSVFSLIKEIHGDQLYSFSFPIDIIKSPEDRVRLFASVPSMITNEEVRSALLRFGDLFQMKTYLILPNGEVLLIKDFNKIYDNLSTIENLYIQKLKDNDSSKRETFEQFRDRMLQIRNNASTVKDIMRATTGLAYIYELIDQFIEDHRVDLQNKMMLSIKEIRQEQEENALLSTELDILNKHAKTILKNDDLDDKFLQCIYNGEEISQEDMISKLSNHMIYREDVINEDQIFIEDTKEDEYRIDTEKLLIVRECGGNIKIFAK